MSTATDQTTSTGCQRKETEKMGVIKKIQHFFYYWYVRYLLATELYMVEPWEKVVVHILFLVLFGLVWVFNYSFVVSSIAQLRSYTDSWEVVSVTNG